MLVKGAGTKGLARQINGQGEDGVLGDGGGRVRWECPRRWWVLGVLHNDSKEKAKVNSSHRCLFTAHLPHAQSC